MTQFLVLIFRFDDFLRFFRFSDSKARVNNQVARTGLGGAGMLLAGFSEINEHD